jgi:eukaryotic-like serine/threonine-protein kinase
MTSEPSSPDAAAVESLVGRIADEFTQRLNRGESPDVAEYAERYPEIRDVLVEALGVLRLVRSPDLNPGELLSPAPEAAGRLGDFRLLREVGRGGMGVVYEAEQISLGRRVALKVLPFASALDARQRQRFENEARSAAQLHHSNIVPVYAVGSERGVHYYAMQFIDGRTLADLIGELRRAAGLGPRADAGTGSTAAPPPALPPGAAPDTRPVAALSTEPAANDPGWFRTAARLIARAAEALEYAHQMGVVHRDVKPANLLLDARGELWVTDFGLARLGSEAGVTRSGDLLGTLRYMSPEQALGRPALVDPRSDVYALGATLYELLCLEPPFAGSDRQELLRQIAAEEPRPLRRVNKAVPVELETVVRKALAKDSSERYSTAGELADDLERFLRDEPVRARRPGPREVAVKWARRHKGLVGGAAVALVVGLVASSVISVLLWRQADHDRRAGERESRERLRAEENLGLALEALDRIYLNVVEDRLPRDPGWAEEDRKLLREALAFYEALARQNGDNPTVRRLAARAYGRVGDIRRRLEHQDKAEEAYRRAIALAEGLAAEFPDDATLRQGLANYLGSLGVLLENARRLDESEKVQRRALALHQELAAGAGADPASRRKLADCYHRLGNVLSVADRPQESAQAYRRCLTLREGLVAAHPNVADYEHDLASTQNNLAGQLLTLGDPRKAEAVFGESIPLLTNLVANHPDTPRYRESLAAGLIDYAFHLRAVGQPGKAEAELHKSLAQGDQLIAQFPAVPDFRRRQARTHDLLAILLSEAGRFKEAEGHYRHALKLLGPLVASLPTVAKARANLSEAQHNLGVMFREAGRTADAEQYLKLARDHARKLTDELPGTPGHWESLAKTHQELGVLFYHTGRVREAEEAWRTALDVYTRLVREWDTVPSYRRELAKANYSLARALRATGRLAGAGSACRSALALDTQLVADFPLVPEYRQHLANTRVLLGGIEADLGRPREANELYRQATTALEALATDCPDVPAFRWSLALAHGHLGLFLRKAGRLGEAERAMRRSLELRARLATDHPAVVLYRYELTRGHTGLAALLLQRRRRAEAEAAYKQAVAVAKALVADHPEKADYRALLGACHTRLGLLAAGAGRDAEARAAYRRALALNPGDALAANNLAWLLVKAADTTRADAEAAVALAEKAVKRAPRNGNFWNTLGAARYRAGRWPAARKALEEAGKLHPEGNAHGGFWLAMTMWRLGERDDARRRYKQAVELMGRRKSHDAELGRLRSEAGALLGVPAGRNDLPAAK